MHARLDIIHRVHTRLADDSGGAAKHDIPQQARAATGGRGWLLRGGGGRGGGRLGGWRGGAPRGGGEGGADACGGGGGSGRHVGDASALGGVDTHVRGGRAAWRLAAARLL